MKPTTNESHRIRNSANNHLSIVQLSNSPSLNDLPHGLQKVMSGSSLSSLTSISSNSNSSFHSRSPPIIHNNYHNHSFSQSNGSFINTKTFSAPISPKYDKQQNTNNSFKLPPIHRSNSYTNYNKNIKCISAKNNNNSSTNNVSFLLLNSEINTKNKFSYYSSKNKLKMNSKTKAKAKLKLKMKMKMKRHQSMSSLHLDLSKLSMIDENYEKYEKCLTFRPGQKKQKSKNENIKKHKLRSYSYQNTPRTPRLNLNENNVNNLLFQFDLPPKSINKSSSFDITSDGNVFTLNEYIISNKGLNIDSKSNVEYPISRNDFIEISILGRGSSSVVYKIWNLKTKEFNALKCISVFEQNKRIQIQNELKLLTSMDSTSNIINFYGSYFYEGQIGFCLEYFDIGSLQTLIEYNHVIPIHITSYIIRSIIYGVQYLHANHKIHRDIKPSNILIKSNAIVKLSDFGILYDNNDGDGDNICNEFIGTTMYMSPERLFGRMYSYSSDIWSIGICVTQSIYGIFIENINDDLSNKIQNDICKSDELVHLIFKSINNNDDDEYDDDDDVIDFMNKCLNRNELLRLNINELLQHPFICKYEANVQPIEFQKYLLNSNINNIKKEKYKNELISMKQSLCDLQIKNKINDEDMQIPIKKIKKSIKSGIGCRIIE